MFLNANILLCIMFLVNIFVFLIYFNNISNMFNDVDFALKFFDFNVFCLIFCAVVNDVTDDLGSFFVDFFLVIFLLIQMIGF